MRIPLRLLCPTYTHAASGSTTKAIICEKCSVTYDYEVRRAARGSGRSFLRLDDDGARFRARVSAEQRLHAKLAKAIEAIPCPSCGYLQTHMWLKARFNYVKRGLTAGLVTSILLPIIVLSLVKGLDHHSPVYRNIFEDKSGFFGDKTVLCGYAAIMPGAILLARAAYRWTVFEPNSQRFREPSDVARTIGRAIGRTIRAVGLFRRT